MDLSANPFLGTSQYTPVSTIETPKFKGSSRLRLDKKFKENVEEQECLDEGENLSRSLSSGHNTEDPQPVFEFSLGNSEELTVSKQKEKPVQTQKKTMKNSREAKFSQFQDIQLHSERSSPKPAFPDRKGFFTFLSNCFGH